MVLMLQTMIDESQQEQDPKLNSIK
jgi:hypothetical protein